MAGKLCWALGLVLLFAGLVSMVEGIGAATGGLSWALLASLFPTMGLAAGGLGLLLARMPWNKK